MKQLWIGLGVLVLLVCLSLGITVLVQRAHEPISRQLAQASQAVLTGNWEQATALFEDSMQRWEGWSDAAGAFVDHSQLEAADGLFVQIQVYAQSRDAIAFAAGCAQLSRLIQSLAESQLPNWQNIL